MQKYSTIIKLRARKLGALIYDARLSVQRTEDDCARAIGVPVETYRMVENGQQAPSLPVLETLSSYLNVPLSHFWENQSLWELSKSQSPQHAGSLQALRNRVIGAQLKQERENLRISPGEVEQATGISASRLEVFESALDAVPLPELEAISTFLGIPIESFFTHDRSTGSKPAPGADAQQLADLPAEIRDFIQKPVNLPYIELAIRLSEMPVEKLRAIAEGLLEITY